MDNRTDLDTACFKAFMAAASTLNFTEASGKAGMTQSGVSQHIARLEMQLGSQLFLRVGKKVLLSKSGEELSRFIQQYYDDVEKLSLKLSERHEQIRGLVSYAMPASCLLSPHFPLLLQARAKYFPELRLSVELCPSEEVISKVLNDEIDFGFVTKKVVTQDLEYIPFCDEEYVLAASGQSKVRIEDKKELLSSDWVTYPGADTLFEIWYANVIPSRNFPSWMGLSFSGKMNSINGAITMVEYGMGISIFPKHCIEDRLSSKRMQIAWAPKNKRCHNTIYIVSLKNKIRAARVQRVIDTFLKM